MKSKKEVTIYDIASELKVSPSTVSRALKDHFSIGKEMIKAVKKVAQEKGYRPNHVAASLRRNKTNTIGVMISWINRPFNSSLISGVEDTASKSGYNVIICQSHDNYENELANAGALYGSRISGLIVSLAMSTTNFDHFKQFEKGGIPIVFVDRVAEEMNTDRVIIDNFSAGYTATKHLIEQGCRRIAHFAGAQHRNVYKDRLRGYLEALRSHNLPVDDSLVIHAKTLGSEEGVQMTQQLLDLPNPPDGIFSSNDTAAVSGIQFAKSRGIKIPDELAFIGFNNDPISEIVEPQLSTIFHPAVEMGKIAAQQVIQHRDQADLVQSETIVLKTDLIIRNSSLKNKK